MVEEAKMTRSRECEAKREERARRAAEKEAAQGKLFLAHEIAPVVKPETIKAKRGGKKAARADGAAT